MKAHGFPDELHTTRYSGRHVQPRTFIKRLIACTLVRRALRALILLYCLAGLYPSISPCRAQDTPTDIVDNQTLQASFLSLKPGSSIGASRLRLHPDGTLDVSIEGETLANVRGIWAVQEARFSASADFTVDKRASFHYRLAFNGYRLMGLHAGRALLSEYDRSERLTQEIWFLFYAAPPKFFTAQHRAKEDDVQ